MNEAQTRFNKIDPKLRDAGCGIVPESKILVEQSAYIAPTLVTKMRQIAKRIILNFHNKKPSTFTIKIPQVSQ